MHTLQHTFQLKIKPQQIYDFRGAVIDLAGPENDLFHNREYNKGVWGNPIERYPKIQYRVDDGSASLWAMEEGVKALKKIMKKGNIAAFEMYDVETPLQTIKEKENKGFVPAVTEDWHYYHLRHFIPFNPEKYTEYRSKSTYKEKISIIEKIIVDEILLFSYAINWSIPKEQRVKVELCDILQKTVARLKTKSDTGDFFIAHPNSYYLQVRTNAALPDGIALGRHKAYGYGVLETTEEDVL